MSAIDFGLIGHPLGHSLSPFIHHSILDESGLSGHYRLYDIPPEKLAETITTLCHELNGFNCTIPYKEAVIPYLSDLDDTANRIRSVNTVWQEHGYNTDYGAFKRACPLKKGSHVLILGAGGVSRTMAFAAADAGCVIWIVTRRAEQAEALALSVREKVKGAQVQSLPNLEAWRAQVRKQDDNGDNPSWTLLNGTPVGLWPNVADMPIEKKDLNVFDFVYDTIYNPTATRLVLAARSAGIQSSGGLGMLFDQALEAQKIWHPGFCFSEEGMKRVRRKLANEVFRTSPMTILLSGFMGSGKTTVGARLAKQSGLLFFDLDQLIEREVGRSISDIFSTDGEAAFRSIERKMLKKMIRKRQSKILATGGGALMGEGIETVLSSGPVLVVFLDVQLESVYHRVGTGQDRPMLSGYSSGYWKKLFDERDPRYRALADLVIDAEKHPETVASDIMRSIGLEGEI